MLDTLQYTAEQIVSQFPAWNGYLKVEQWKREKSEKWPYNRAARKYL